MREQEQEAGKPHSAKSIHLEIMNRPAIPDTLCSRDVRRYWEMLLSSSER